MPFLWQDRCRRILELKEETLFWFCGFGEAFDRVPREVISWAMRKLAVEEWLVSAVMSMHSGAKTVVRTVYGYSKSFAPRFSIKPTVIRDCHEGHI